MFVRFSTVRRLARLGRHRARRARLRGQVLHRRRQLRPGRQQHAGLLHPGRDQVPRLRPRGEARAAQRDPAGGLGARHVLGFRLADARVGAHGDVGDVRPRASRAATHDGGLRRPHLPPGQRRGQVALRQVPLEAGARACTRWCGTRRRRSPARTPTSTAATCGRRSSAATTPSGSSACRSSRRQDEHEFDFDILDPTKLIPEELVPVAPRRQDDAEPQPRQLLRRDRAGRVLRPATSCRASTSPTTRCCRGGCSLPRHAAHAASAGRTSHEMPINRPRCPVHNNQRDGFAPDADPDQARQRTTRTRIGGGCPMLTPASAGGFVQLPREGRAATRSASAARPSATTSARRRCSANSQSRREQEHIVAAFRSSWARSSGRDPRADGRTARRRSTPALAREVAASWASSVARSGRRRRRRAGSGKATAVARAQPRSNQPRTRSQAARSPSSLPTVSSAPRSRR